MARTLALPPKRFKLDIIGEGWQDCYVDYRPLVPRDLLEIQELNPKSLTPEQQTEYMINLIAKHVVGGKIRTDSDGVTELQQGDIGYLPTDVVVELFTTLNGGAGDPKDIPLAQTPSNVPTTEPSN